MVSMEVTFPQEIEPSFLAVRLKKNTKPPGCPLAVFAPFPPPPTNFQTSSVIKFATFHIKHVWLLLLCRI